MPSDDFEADPLVPDAGRRAPDDARRKRALGTTTVRFSNSRRPSSSASSGAVFAKVSADVVARGADLAVIQQILEAAGTLRVTASAVGDPFVQTDFLRIAYVAQELVRVLLQREYRRLIGDAVEDWFVQTELLRIVYLAQELVRVLLYRECRRILLRSKTCRSSP